MLGMCATAWAQQPIRLANEPALSPDGGTLAFAWRGEIWTSPATGGSTRQLTKSAAADGQPSFSPDGTQLAFVSGRSGSDQGYVMPAQGGIPKQITFHTSGYTLHGWYPDGRSVLTSGRRDHSHDARASQRIFRVRVDERAAEELVFDDYGSSPALSPDGKRLFIADMRGNKTYVYDIAPDGSLINKTLFCEMGSDGMTIDTKGNIYITGRGVTVFDNTGKKIGNIAIPESWTANVCFGGKDFKSLYITASKGLYRMKMNVKGTKY
jgi:Tol biopolymer transport system component